MDNLYRVGEEVCYLNHVWIIKGVVGNLHGRHYLLKLHPQYQGGRGYITVGPAEIGHLQRHSEAN